MNTARLARWIKRLSEDNQGPYGLGHDDIEKLVDVVAAALRVYEEDSPSTPAQWLLAKALKAAIDDSFI